jgi:catechol 2,3-dioxygenase-like lactoylglutathione lyase family enzyme
MTPKVHVHLHAADLSRSRAFYRAFFGAEPVKERPGYLKFLPDFAPLNLAISERATSPGGTTSHLGIQLDATTDVLRHLARVKDAGLDVRVEMGVDCCHANQDKFWVRDPDGVEWEIYRLNRDLEPSIAVPIAAPAACCAPGASACATDRGDLRDG